MDQLVRSLNTTQMRRATAITIVWCSLLVLPSCIPPLRNPKPGPGLPESFNLRKADPQSDLPEVFDHADSPENSVYVKIEEFFNDPMLTNMMHRAMVGNQELRVRNEEVQIASNEILARQGAYLPFVYPGVGSGIEKFGSFTLPGAGIRDDPFRPGQFFPNPLPNYLLGFTFLWTPDIWYQLHNARDAAAMRYYATAEGRNFFVTRLIAEIAENYFRLMALDARLENLNRIIALQERSYEIAKARKEAARATDLPVLRFLAEVRRNQSEKLIVYQDIIEAENRINFSLGRNPQRVERRSGNINDLIDLRLHSLSVGVPAELLRNRPDIRQAERELAATGLDVLVARKRFYPQGLITSGVGYQAFNPTYLFITPESIAANVAGNLLVPFINRKAIKADYYTANARQLQAVYNYQRVVLMAFTELINRLAKVENYRNSIEIKKRQVQSLEEAVAAATSLYNLPRAELPVDYLDVLTAQNELFAAVRDLIVTKAEQLSAIVNTYQALGGGSYLFPIPVPKPLQPYHHRWPHLWHSHASAAARRGPGPVPAPPEGPPRPPPTPLEEASPEQVPAPSEGPPRPPSTAAEEKGSGLAPTPAAETRLEPLPMPMGGGNGSGTGSNTKDPPR